MDETEVSLVQRECRADFPEESSQLLDPSEWRLGAYSGFFREENIIVLEACSVSYAVRCAQRNYPTGRLLILSDNLALVLALCKGRSNNSHASYLCVLFQGRYCLIVQVDTVGDELFRQGKSFL